MRTVFLHIRNHRIQFASCGTLMKMCPSFIELLHIMCRRGMGMRYDVGSNNDNQLMVWTCVNSRGYEPLPDNYCVCLMYRHFANILVQVEFSYRLLYRALRLHAACGNDCVGGDMLVITVGIIYDCCPVSQIVKIVGIFITWLWYVCKCRHLYWYICIPWHMSCIRATWIWQPLTYTCRSSP